MSTKVQTVQSLLEGAEFDAILLTQIANVRWISEFRGSAGYALITPSSARFLTDSRYSEAAHEQVQGLEVTILSPGKKPEQVIADWCDRLNVSKVGFEPEMPYGTYVRYRDAINRSMISLETQISELRMIKTPKEVEKIESACKIADACMEHISRMIQPGVTEIDICLDLEFFIRRQGAKVAFDPIVVSGERSSRPHGTPSEKKLAPGDFVTIDLGAQLDGYCSDITRTFVVSEASARHEEIYNQVLKAEVEAIKALVPGGNGRDVDQLARDILAEKNLDQYFTHGLGHGLGTEVHDTGRLHHSTDQPLAAGQVWTVEPGVYIAGFGGVRIEDDVVITPEGPRILTHFPKELMVLP